MVSFQDKAQMSSLLHQAIPALVIFSLVAVLGFLIYWGRALYTEQGLPVRSREILTRNETEFLGRLKRALPDFEILPQVSMGALLEVNLPADHPDYWRIRRHFGLKVVDYIVCQKGSMTVVAAVELDDCTHDNKQLQDAQRDEMLSAAGIPTIRWDSRKKPSQEAIAQRFAELVMTKPKVV